MPLPNEYETAQGRALRDAIRKAVSTGGQDLTEVFNLVNHLVAEGRDDMPSDFYLAPVVFGLAMEAQQQGKPKLAKALHAFNAQWCSREAVALAIAGGLLAGARTTGWLPAVEYDRLVALVAEIGGGSSATAQVLLAGIERREV